MALYTNGYKQNAMVLLASGDSETDTNVIDIAFGAFKTAGYYHYKIFLTDMYISNSYELRALPMASASSFVGGLYGGYFSHGESYGDITYNDNNFNNLDYVPISAGKTASTITGTYRGHFEIDWNARKTSNGMPNVHWHGNMRTYNVNSAHIAGACTGTQGSDYGVRITTNASNNGAGVNAILGHEYAVYGIPTS